MTNRASLGAGGVIIVAILALLFGAAGGFAASRLAGSPTKIERITTVSSNPVQPAASTTSQAPMSWTQVVQKVGPAVVTIINQQQSQQTLFGVQPGVVDEGSGFIIDKKGDIVTNNHVIDQAQSLQVVFADGHKVGAQLVRQDRLHDLAVIRIKGSVPAILHFGNSTQLLPGEPVLAIGSALGQYRNTVTSGVVSATGRTIQEPATTTMPYGNTLNDMIQTDAAINQGNSGGPLLNDRGQVVGINTAITRGAQSTNLFGASDSAVAEGLGFAIPSSIAQGVVKRLALNKAPAFLGVQYHEVTQQDHSFYNLPVGAYINTIQAGSPAAKAGLQTRDVITKVNRKPLTGMYSLERTIANHVPGDKITLTVWRNSHTLTIRVTLGAQS